ncbi:MAG TPA: FixH family protein [Spirochaetota bacterium]|nr:FixH family protein [Spirochaetota bacterium]
MIRKILLIPIIASIVFIFGCKGSSDSCCSITPPSTGTGTDAPVLTSPGSRIAINNDLSFTYAFDKKPALGTAILKIQVFDKSGKQVSDLAITGDSGMPSMKGHHDSGDVAFQKNRKGDYLMPVQIVMPGDWAVRVKIAKDGAHIYTGLIRFDV